MKKIFIVVLVLLACLSGCKKRLPTANEAAKRELDPLYRKLKAEKESEVEEDKEEKELVTIGEFVDVPLGEDETYCIIDTADNSSSLITYKNDDTQIVTGMRASIRYESEEAVNSAAKDLKSNIDDCDSFFIYNNNLNIVFNSANFDGKTLSEIKFECFGIVE